MLSAECGVLTLKTRPFPLECVALVLSIAAAMCQESPPASGLDIRVRTRSVIIWQYCDATGQCFGSIHGGASSQLIGGRQDRVSTVVVTPRRSCQSSCLWEMPPCSCESLQKCFRNGIHTLGSIVNRWGRHKAYNLDLPSTLPPSMTM